MRAAEGRAPREQQPADRPWSVSELVARVDHAIRDGLPPRVRVLGEISGLRERTHCWFDLKDADAVIPCVMFASALRRLPFRPESGQSVVAHARVEVYAPQGRVQLSVDRLEPVGAGALELRLRQLVDELRALGYLDEDRKRTPPWFPRRVAVVTSRSGAALQDVLATMRARCPAVDVLVADVRVQGAHAAPEIARAIRTLSDQRSQLAIDAIVVTRGGGSIEDLWAFNERVVADAIVNSAVPVIAAIGHETDTTIAELVADLRCSTPTRAAMSVTPDRAELAQQCALLRAQLDAALSARSRAAAATAAHLQRSLAVSLRLARTRRAAALDRLSARLAAVRPEAVYAARRAVVRELSLALHASARHRLNAARPADLRRRLDRALADSLSRARTRVHSDSRALEAVSPRAVLRRGYSVTSRQDGSVIRSPDEARPGEVLVTRLAEGELRSIVEGRPPRRHTPPPRRPDDPGLFAG